MLDQFSYLLSQVAENPQKRLDQYTLVTPVSKLFCPIQLNRSMTLGKGRFTTLFSRQAERVPDLFAVVDPNERWTYSRS